jgi:hypothetical protein
MRVSHNLGCKAVQNPENLLDLTTLVLRIGQAFTEDYCFICFGLYPSSVKQLVNILIYQNSYKDASPFDCI